MDDKAVITELDHLAELRYSVETLVDDLKRLRRLVEAMRADIERRIEGARRLAEERSDVVRSNN